MVSPWQGEVLPPTPQSHSYPAWDSNPDPWFLRPVRLPIAPAGRGPPRTRTGIRVVLSYPGMPIPISGLWRKVEESNSYAQHVPQGSSLVADHPTAPSVSSVGRQDSVEDQHPSMPQPDHRCPAHRLGLFVLHPRWCERAEVGIAPSHLQQWCPDLPPGYPGAGLSHRRSCRPKESNLTSHQAPGLQPGRNPSSKIDERAPAEQEPRCHLHLFACFRSVSAHLLGCLGRG